MKLVTRSYSHDSWTKAANSGERTVNTDQMQGMCQQVTGLFLQSCGAIFGHENCVLKGRTMRMRGYLRTRLGNALQLGHRLMRRLRLVAAVQLQR